MSDVWLNTPTGNGLWWVEGSGSIALLRLTLHMDAMDGSPVLWMIKRMGEEDADIIPLPVAWRFARAVPPALPEAL